MGKIGDLWVRLGMKKDEFDRGLNEAENSVKDSGKRMNDVFNTLKGIGVAAYAAIAAGAVKAFKDVMDSSQKLGDYWNNNIVAGMKGAWSTFISSLASFDWQGFGKRIGQSIKAARDLASAQDNDFEVNNSVRLRLMAFQAERLQLEEAARNPNLSNEERQAAIDKLQTTLDNIYADQKTQAQRVLDKAVDLFDIRSGIRLDNDQLAAAIAKLGSGDLYDAISEIGTHLETTANPNGSFSSAYMGMYGGGSTTSRVKNVLSDDAARLIADATKELGFDFEEFVIAYKEKNGDNSIKELVKAYEDFYEATNASAEEMRRFKNLSNTLTHQGGNGASGEPAFVRPEWGENIPAATAHLQKMAEVLNEVGMAEREILKPEGWDDYVAFLQNMEDITQQAAIAISDAIVDGIGESIQYLTDALFGLEELNGAQLFGALLSPLADACVQIGKSIMAEGIAAKAFQNSLASPEAAIAAGAALIAVGSAAKSAISSAIGSVTGAYPQTGADSTSTASTPYSGELTINVSGIVQGDNIVITGQRAINNWDR